VSVDRLLAVGELDKKLLEIGKIGEKVRECSSGLPGMKPSK